MVKQKAEITITTGDLVSVPVAAKALKVHLATIYRWIKKGIIFPFCIGSQSYIPIKEIERLKRERGEA